jgi:L-asparaginase II
VQNDQQPGVEPADSGPSLQVQLWRGDVVESVHDVDVVVAGPDGPMLTRGSARRPVIARSALKFVQAVPLVRTGAADHFGLQPHELVLACSSHSAEAAHVEAVEAWLARLGLSADDLECGPDLPINTEASAARLAAGAGPSAIDNCCSGKHAGFLTVARHLQVDHVGYIEPDHPVQQLVTAAVEEFTGHHLGDQQPGCDGCGIPTFGIPLAALARSMALLVSSDDTATGLGPEAATAAKRLVEANLTRQFWISGTGRHEMTLADGAVEPIVSKGGAEGVFFAGLPQRGVGVAVKALDGAGRAAELAVSWALARLGAVGGDPIDRPVATKAGRVTGRLTVVDRPSEAPAGH